MNRNTVTTAAADATALIHQAREVNRERSDRADILSVLGSVASGAMSTTEAYEILDDGIAARNPSFVRALTKLLQDFS